MYIFTVSTENHGGLATLLSKSLFLSGASIILLVSSAVDHLGGFFFVTSSSRIFGNIT